MTVAHPPSGEQYPISAGSHRAVVVSVGGGVRSYDLDGRAVLDGYDESDMADGARGQSLIPWPNRVQDGRWSWHGQQLQLSLTEPSQHNAIHGLLRWLPWQVLDRSEAQVELGATVVPQPGYPWQLRVRNRWTIGGGGLSTRTLITNDGGEAVPVGCGFHPYLTVGTPTIDSSTLHLPADTWLPTGEQQIPTGRSSVAGSDYDFRHPRPIADTKLDYTFTDLHRGSDGRFRLTLSGDDRAVAVWLDGAFGYVEVFSGDALPDPGRRRRGLGVEPMSCPPNALVSGESVVTLAPGETWEGNWGIEPQPGA